MSNPPRAKGTRAESALVKWLRVNGFGHADRQPLRGGRDQGDITACPGIVIEVKSYRLPTGVPTRGQLTEWMTQTEVERWNAAADIAVLVVKRPGTTDPGRWFAYVTAWTLADLIAGTSRTVIPVDLPDLEAPVCLSVASLTALLRAAGWGDPNESEAA